MKTIQLKKDALESMINVAVGTAFDKKLEERSGMVGVGGLPGGNALGGHSSPLGIGGAMPQIRAEKSHERKGLSLARWIQCTGGSQLIFKEKGRVASPKEIAAQFYPEDDMLKAALDFSTKALSIGDFTSGGAFGMTEMAAEVIEFLRPQAAVRGTGVTVMQMRTGAIRISKVTRGSAATYVGENQLGGITQPSTGDVELTRKKLKAEIPSSNDLFRFAVVNADAVIRDDLVRALAQREDAAFIRDDGSQFTPRGLRFIVPPQNVIVAGANTLTGIQATLSNLKLAIRNNDVPAGGWWWLMAPRTEERLMSIRTGVNENFAFRDEMMAGNLQGVPFKSTTQIPTNLGGGSDSELYIFASQMFIIGEAMDLEITTSLEAAYFDGTALRSAFSRDQMVIRAIMQHDFGSRHDFAVAVSADIDWVPA